MRLSFPSPLHLTYCQNIHPGETWGENLQSLHQKALAVRDLLKIHEPFGLGLRLGERATEDLLNPEARGEGRIFFESESVYPFTINGFPYGRFHKGPVKERVYAPDWRSSERLRYTCALADILADWTPEGSESSISTVPGSYAAWIESREDEAAIARTLGHAVAHLARIERDRGRYLHLGLEPEPDCFLETTAQTVDFFEDALPAAAIPVLVESLEISPQKAETLLRRHLGVCFDTCHIALQFESLATSLETLEKAGIKISKIQLSAALKSPATADGIAALRQFQEPTYLHQVKARDATGALQSWRDLPDALDGIPSHAPPDELRVHFHVPLFFAPRSPLQSTRDALNAAFWAKVRSGICPHLEIETYTFDVLPPEAHPGDVVSSIAEEYRWVLAQIQAG